MALPLSLCVWIAHLLNSWLFFVESVLKFSVTWNTNSRNCHEAQAVLKILLQHEAPEFLLQYEGIKTAVESLLPYTGELQKRSIPAQLKCWQSFLTQWLIHPEVLL